MLLATTLGLSAIGLAAPATAAPSPSLIDDFQTVGTTTIDATAPGTATGSDGAGSGSVLGGTRSTTLTVTTAAASGSLTFAASGVGTITAPSDLGGSVELDYASGKDTDITAGKTMSAIRTRVDAATPGATLTVTVGQGGPVGPAGAKCATATQAVPAASGRAADVIMPLASLAAGPGCTGTVDFTKVRTVAVLITLPGPGTGTATSITLGRIDTVAVGWGTLPSAYKATLSADDGASHVLTPGVLQLGATTAASADGNPGGTSSAADGVAITPGTTWTPGGASSGSVDVTGIGTGCLAGWIDWNGNGSLDDASDAVVANLKVTLSSSPTTVTFPVPASFSLGTYPVGVTVNSRWRLFPTDTDGTCSTAESYRGSVEGGEVEDYARKLTPAPPAPTITASPGNLIGSGPDSTGNLTTATWSFTVPTGTTASCRLLVAGAPVTSFAPCAGSVTYPLGSFVATLTDGAYGVEVEDTETGTPGRTSTSAVATYTLDRIAPASPIIKTAPQSPGRTRTPQWTITAETGSTITCTVLDGSTQIAQSTCVTSMPAGGATVQMDLTGKADSTYTLQLTARDAAGNPVAGSPTAPPPTTSSYQLDTVAPAAPTLGPLPASPRKDRSPTWTFDLPAGAAGETCEVVAGTDASGPVLPNNGPTSCAGSFQANLTGVADGPVTFVVTAADAAGNVSAAATSTVTLDTVAAAPSITSGPSPLGKGTSVSWGFSGEAGATFTCALSKGATSIVDPTTCTSPMTYDLSGHGDGTYTFSVFQTDKALNTSSTTTADYVLDTTAPTITGVTPPASPSALANPSWTLTSDDPQTTWTCTLTGPGGFSSTPPSCGTGTTTTVSFALGTQLDGTYTLTFSAKDTAGNIADGTPSTFVLKRVAGAPVITASPADPGNVSTLTWTFTTLPATTVECRLDLDGATVQDWTACSGTYSKDASGLADGSYTFSARATNQFGSLSVPATSTVVLDRVAPAAPTIVGPASPGHNLTPTWTFTAEAGAHTTCEVVSGSTVLLPWSTCAGQLIQPLSGEPDGTYTLHVQATDAAGNVGGIGSSSYVLDTVPDVPVITAHPASPGNTRSPTWSFTTEPGATAECRLVNGSQIVYDLATCSKSKTYALSGRPDGTYTFGVRDTDAAGNVSSEVTSPYSLVTSAPAAPTLDGPVGPSRVTTATWTVTGSPSAITRCRLLTPAGVVKTDWTPCAGSWTQQLTGGPDGSWIVQAQSSDQAGNVSPTTTLLYALDTTPPAVPSITGSPSPDPGTDAHPTWTFTIEPGSVALCDLAWGDVQVASVSPCTSPATFDLTTFPDGTYNLTVTAIDAAGNTSPTATDSYRLARRDATGNGSGNAGNGSGSGAGPGSPSGGGITEHGGGTGGGGGGGSTTIIDPASGPRPPLVVPKGTHSGPRADGTVRIAHPPTTTHAPATTTAPTTPRRAEDDSSFGSTVQNLIKEAPTRAALPVALLLVVALFLLVQDRLDRSDPKLALAPVRSDDDLEFR
ncbi:MAG TPA: Ig-like domain repeat protein [Mycobacteriales bacterium]|nr:Ig-like domain repeat protein [Mycobacteriales bacterium]